MAEKSYQVTATARERYFAARDAFEEALWYRHLGQLEAVIAVMNGQYEAAVRRLAEDRLTR